MPLSNINSVMAEANSGKMVRRLYFQDELPAGTTESTAEPGLTTMNKHLKLTFVWTLIHQHIAFNR